MIDAQKERAELFQKQQLWKANMVIKACNDPELTYKDCVMLLKDTIDTLEVLGPFDQATEHFVRLVHTYRTLCTAHALVNGEEARDHLQEVPVIWTYDQGNVIEETTLWIPLGVRPSAIDFELKVAGTLRLAKAGVDPKKAYTLEVVRA